MLRFVIFLSIVTLIMPFSLLSAQTQTDNIIVLATKQERHAQQAITGSSVEFDTKDLYNVSISLLSLALYSDIQTSGGSTETRRKNPVAGIVEVQIVLDSNISEVPNTVYFVFVSSVSEGIAPALENITSELQNITSDLPNNTYEILSAMDGPSYTLRLNQTQDKVGLNFYVYNLWDSNQSMEFPELPGMDDNDDDMGDDNTDDIMLNESLNDSEALNASVLEVFPLEGEYRRAEVGFTFRSEEAVLVGTTVTNESTTYLTSVTSISQSYLSPLNFAYVYALPLFLIGAMMVLYVRKRQK